jgi:hypothetical protein
MRLGTVFLKTEAVTVLRKSFLAVNDKALFAMI